MYTVLVVVQVMVALGLVGLVLIQHGKGADAGAAFGSGSSGTVFGARGAANFLSRATAWLAFVFFSVSLALAYLVGAGSGSPKSVVDGLATEAPAITAPAPAIPEETAAPAATDAKPAEEAPKIPE